MSNLLPPTERTRLRRDQTVRSVVFLGAAVAILAAVIACALLPAYILLAAHRASLQQELDSFAASAEANAQQTDRESVAHTRLQLQALEAVLEQEHLPSDALRSALDAAPASIRITEVQYEAGDPTSKLTLRGTTNDRAALVAYTAALKQLDMFEAASTPIGSLAATDEGRFTITAHGSF